MISIPDMAILGAIALILFGPEQLPKIARKAGHVMRDVQNTSEAFIREMERAADDYTSETPIPRHDFADPAATVTGHDAYVPPETSYGPYEPYGASTAEGPAGETHVEAPAVGPEPATAVPAAAPAAIPEPPRSDVPLEAFAVPEPEPHGNLAAYGHVASRPAPPAG